MEQKREQNKKIGWVITILSIGELIAALGIVAYGLLNGRMSGTTSNIIMGGALGLYWVLADIVEPLAVHRFDGITQVQKEAYVKYIVLDLIGYAGIACFLFGVGGSGGNTGMLGAVVYVVVMKPKRQNQQIFYGIIDPEAEAQEKDDEPEAVGEEIQETVESSEEATLIPESVQKEENGEE